MKKKKTKEINNAMVTNTKVLQAMVANITNKQAQILLDGKIIPCLLPSSLISRKHSLVPLMIILPC